MDNVSIRELRNSGGDVVDRAERGEHMIITRNGNPVAELRPIASPPPSTTELIARRAHLPQVDPRALRQDIDDLIDPSL